MGVMRPSSVREAVQVSRNGSHATAFVHAAVPIMHGDSFFTNQKTVVNR